MLDYQFITIIVLIVGGFGWMKLSLSSINIRLSNFDNRITILENRMKFFETIFEMIQLPFKLPKA